MDIAFQFATTPDNVVIALLVIGLIGVVAAIVRR